jgi:cytochrome c5
MRRITPFAFFAVLLLVGATSLSAQEKAPVTPHDLAGKENCAMCHAEGVMGATKFPAGHEAIDQANCQLCHAADSPVQVAEGAAPAIPHDMAGKENCAMCHAEGVMGATKTPANHGDIGQEKCSVCHTMGEKTM